MKSFESNLQDNRLLLYPELDQCWVGPRRPEERHFSSLFYLLIHYQDKHRQCSAGASISVSMISLPVCTSPLLSTPCWLSQPHSKDRWKVCTRRTPTPYRRVHHLTFSGKKRFPLGPFVGSRLLETLKRSRVWGTKHNISARHIHMSTEEAQVYLISLATVPMSWKCTFKERWIVGFVLPLEFRTLTSTKQEQTSIPVFVSVNSMRVC